MSKKRLKTKKTKKNKKYVDFGYLVWYIIDAAQQKSANDL